MEGQIKFGKEEAHEEANMVNAHLGVSPETGKLEAPLNYREMWFGNMSDGRPTNEQYEKGLREVEKLIETAQNDPEKGALMSKTLNLAIIMPQVATRLLVLSALYAGKTFPAILGTSRPEAIDRVVNEIKELYKSAAGDQVNTPDKRLEDLKNKSEKYI